MPHHLPQDQQIEIPVETVKSTVYELNIGLQLSPIDFKDFPVVGCGEVFFHGPSQAFDSSLLDPMKRQDPVKFGYGNDGVKGKHFFHLGSRICANCAEVFGGTVDIQYLAKVGYCDPKLVEIQRFKIHTKDRDIQLCDY